MGPHERAALERQARELRAKSNLSPWDARILDKIEAELEQQALEDRIVGRDVHREVHSK